MNDAAHVSVLNLAETKNGESMLRDRRLCAKGHGRQVCGPFRAVLKSAARFGSKQLDGLGSILSAPGIDFGKILGSRGIGWASAMI